jgi:hypothetical protein
MALRVMTMTPVAIFARLTRHKTIWPSIRIASLFDAAEMPEIGPSELKQMFY